MSTDTEPIEIECPECSGHGCDECNNGQIKILGCPDKYCRDIAPTTELIELFDKGLPPVAGGVYDQSAWFIQAARQLKRDEALAKSDG